MFLSYLFSLDLARLTTGNLASENKIFHTNVILIGISIGIEFEIPFLAGTHLPRFQVNQRSVLGSIFMEALWYLSSFGSTLRSKLSSAMFILYTILNFKLEIYVSATF